MSLYIIFIIVQRPSKKSFMKIEIVYRKFECRIKIQSWKRSVFYHWFAAAEVVFLKRRATEPT